MKGRLWLGALVVGGLLACARSQADPTPVAVAAAPAAASAAAAVDATREAAAVPVAAPGSAAATRPADRKPADSCAQLDATFQDAKKAGGACLKAADCACHPDLRIDGARAASDATTARTLTRLSNDYRRQKCPTIWASGAAPPPCKPICQSGRCAIP